MQSDVQPAVVSNKVLWTGRVLSALPLILLLVTGAFSVLAPAKVAQGVEHLGYPASLARPIGLLELACAILYAIPRTAVFGAVFLTAYLGGATASHIRIGEPPFMAIVVCIIVWLGIYLREPRLRALAPIRK